MKFKDVRTFEITFDDMDCFQGHRPSSVFQVTKLSVAGQSPVKEDWTAHGMNEIKANPEYQRLHQSKLATITTAEFPLTLEVQRDRVDSIITEITDPTTGEKA